MKHLGFLRYSILVLIVFHRANEGQGGAHPKLMGSTFQQAFPELWGDIEGVFETAERNGLSADVNEIPLFTERNGFLEETYFTGNFNPLRDIDGSIGGFYNAAHEITKQKVGSRRMAM